LRLRRGDVRFSGVYADFFAPAATPKAKGGQHPMLANL